MVFKVGKGNYLVGCRQYWERGNNLICGEGSDLIKDLVILFRVFSQQISQYMFCDSCIVFQMVGLMMTLEHNRV